MSYTSDDIRKITGGRGAKTASSSNSKKSYTADDIRKMTNPQTSAYEDYAQKATAPVADSGIGYDQSVIDKYEAMPSYNVFERLFDANKSQAYSDKQALKSQYDTETKKRDIAKMEEYGLTLSEIKKLTEYSGNLNTHSKEEMSPIFEKASRVQNETGINPYSYTKDFLDEIWAEEAKAHPIQGTVQATIANPVFATADMLDKGVKYATGTPLQVNPNLTRSKRQAVSEGIDSEAGKFAYDALNSYADMGVAMLLGAATGGSALVVGGVQGLEKASDVTDSAIERGLTPNQIMAQGVASGITTAVTEAIPYSRWAKFAEKGFSGVPKEQIAKLLVSKLAISFGEEASQEMLEEVADTLVDRIISGDNSEINNTIRSYMEQGMSEEEAKKQTWKDWGINLAKEGLAGGIGGLLFGGGALGIGNYRNANLGQNVNRQALSETINTLNPESESYQNLQNLGGNLDNASNLQVGELVQKAYADASQIDKTSYTDALTEAFKNSELGATMNESEINDIVNAVVAEKRNSAQRSLLKNESVKEIIDGVNETEGRRLVMEATHKRAEVARSVTSNDATNKALKKSGHKIGVKTEANGEEIKIKDVKSEDGKIKIYTDNGEVSNVTLSPSDAAMSVVASGIENENERRAFISNYDGKQNVAEYTDSFRLAYEYGRRGMGEDVLREDIGQTINLPVETAVNAYVAGENETRRAGESLESALNETRGEVKGLKKGEFDTSRIDVKELSATQRAMYSVADFFSDLGVDVVLFNNNSAESPNGFYEDGKVWINLSAYYGTGYKFDKGYVLNTMSHELTHWMEANDSEGFEALKEAIKNYYGDEKYAELISDEQSRYDKKHEKKMSYTAAESEVIARSCEDMLSSAKTFEDILMGVDEKTQLTIVDKFKEFLDKIGEVIKRILRISSPSKPAQMLRKNAEEFEKIRQKWVDNITSAIANVQSKSVYDMTEQAIIEDNQAVIERLVGEVEDTRLNSLKMNDDLASDAVKANNESGKKDAKFHRDMRYEMLSPMTLNRGIGQRKDVARDLNNLIEYLPDDIEGNIIEKNGSYGRSVEHSLICVRSLVNKWFVSRVANEVGRPLNVEEQIAASEILAGKVGNERECQYCYVAADRKLYEASFGVYLDGIKQIQKNVSDNREAAQKEYEYLQKNYDKLSKIAQDTVKRKKYKDKNAQGFVDFLNGREMTLNMLNRYMRAEEDALSGKTMLEGKHLSSAEVRMSYSDDPVLGWYINDATRYAKSASHAKLMGRDVKINGTTYNLEYIAYNGNVLTMDDATIKALNDEFGLRLYSDSDFVPAFILEDMQVVTDAAVRRLKMLAYTKDVDFADAFASTGMNINISTYATLDLAYRKDEALNKARDEYNKNKNDETRKAYLDLLNKYVLPDAMQGADIERVKDLRKQYPNVGSVFVATNDDLVEWALAQDWVDVIIPYHTVYSVETQKYFGFENYKGMQEDKKADKNADMKSIPPTMHENSLEKYEEALKKHHLTKRFPKWADNPNYMKLVNETRQAYNKTNPVVPDFNKDAINRILARIPLEGKYGYGNGFNSFEEQEAAFGDDLETAVKLIESGKTSKEDLKKFMSGETLLSDKVETMPSNEVDSEGRVLTIGQAERFKNSKVRDNDGNLLRMYHGTGEEFYEFLHSKIGSHGAFEGAGFNFTPSEGRAKGYGGKVLDGYVNVEHPLSAERKTISVSNLAKIIAEIDPTGDDLIANYARDTRDYGTKAFVDRESKVMARLIWQSAENDVDIYSEMSSASGGKTTLIKAFEDLGYDGVIHYDEGKIKTVIAFESNQFKDADNLTPTESPDRRYSLKDDGLVEKDNKTLGYTNERIDKLLSGGYYGATAKNYAQAYIAYMSPDDFLKLTTGKNQRAIDQIKDWRNNEWNDGDRPPFDMEKFADSYNYQPIQLITYENNDEVYGHEGRHRMWQLKLLGYERVPVLIFNPDNKYNKESIESLKIKPQWFQEADDSINDSDRVEIKDLIPFSQGNADLIKEKFGEGSKADTLFSEKIDDPIADISGYNRKLEAQNTKLKEDLERLNRKLRLQSKTTNGKAIDERSLDTIARVLINSAQSKADANKVKEGLKDVYSYILDNSNGVIEYDVMMSKAYDVARQIMNEAKPVKIVDDYMKEIIDTMRRAKIKLTPEQEQEAKYTFGESAHKALWGRLNISKEGRSLDSYWSEWSEMYPNIFDADTNPNDQITELSRIYDDMKDASTILQTFNSHSDIMAMAEEVYNKFWLLKTETTVADKYEAEVKRLNHEHRNAMKEVKEENQKQILADAMHYGKVIAKIKRESEKRESDIKKRMNENLAKVRADRDAKISDLKARNREKLSEVRKDRDTKIADLKAHQREKDADRRDRAERRRLIMKITETSKDLGTRLAKNSQKNPVPIPIQAPLRNLLNAIDFSSKQFLGLGNQNKVGVQTKADVSMSYLINKLNEGIEQIQSNNALADDENEKTETRFEILHLPPNFTQELREIANRLQEAENAVGQHDIYTLQLMSTADLEKLYKVVKGIKTAVNNLNKIISTNNAHSVDYIGHEIVRDLTERGQKRFDNKAFNFMEVANKTPYYYFKHLGEGGKELFSFLQNGWDTLADNVETIKNFTSKLYTNKEIKEWDNHVNEFTVNKNGEEKTVYITDAQLMSLYCLSKREQAMGHIMSDGIIIDEIDVKGRKKIARQDALTLTENELSMMLSIVESNPRMKEVADKLQEFMNTVCSAWGNEVTEKLYGIDSFTEKNYFPIDVNKDTLNSEVKDRGSSIYGMLNRSFTKPLTEGARNEINIANIFDVFVDHAESMAKYNALAIPSLDVIKVWNYKEVTDLDEGKREVEGVKKAITKALGKAGNSYISGLLKDLNGDYETGRYDSTWTGFTKKYKTAAVAANVQTALMQPLAYIRAAYMIDSKYLQRALLHKPQIAKCINNVGVAKWKSMGFYDTNLTFGLDKIVRNSNTAVEQFVDKSLWLTEKMDEITWGYLYNAVEIEQKEKGLTGEKLDEAVALRLRDILYGTQVFDSTLSRSAIMRSKTAIVQMETAFMAEPTLSVNMLMDATTEFANEAKKHGYQSALNKYGKTIGRAALVYVVSSVVESALRGVIGKIRDYDDDEEEFEGLFEDILNRTLHELNVLEKVPYIKDIFEIWQGYNVTNMNTAFEESTYKAYQAVVKAMRSGNWTYKTYKRIFEAASQITGLPVGNLTKEFKTLWNNTIGRAIGNYIK